MQPYVTASVTFLTLFIQQNLVWILYQTVQCHQHVQQRSGLLVNILAMQGTMLFKHPSCVKRPLIGAVTYMHFALVSNKDKFFQISHLQPAGDVTRVSVVPRKVTVKFGDAENRCRGCRDKNR